MTKKFLTTKFSLTEEEAEKALEIVLSGEYSGKNTKDHWNELSSGSYILEKYNELLTYIEKRIKPPRELYQKLLEVADIGLLTLQSSSDKIYENKKEHYSMLQSTTYYLEKLDREGFIESLDDFIDRTTYSNLLKSNVKQSAFHRT